MKRHELSRGQHSHDGGMVPCTGVHALYPSLGFGWREVLSWYLVGLARSWGWMARGIELILGRAG